MKTYRLLSLLILLIASSCSSISVYQDYDKNVNFSNYKTYAFHKSGIDKAEISDLDKKRILRAIDQSMTAKGFIKSENPDVLISFFTKEQEQVDVTNFNMGWGWGWGWGWNPWFWGGNSAINRYTEGTLLIDIIDTAKKELVWQGEGIGVLTKNPEKKDEKINEFVSKILAQYPPQKK